MTEVNSFGVDPITCHAFNAQRNSKICLKLLISVNNFYVFDCDRSGAFAK